MTTASQKLPPLPSPLEPIQMSDGTVNPRWYEWLKALEAIVKIIRTEV